MHPSNPSLRLNQIGSMHPSAPSLRLDQIGSRRREGILQGETKMWN